MHLDFKIITKNSKRFIRLAEIKLNLDIKNFNTQFGNRSSMQDYIFHNFLGQNQEEIIKTVKPRLEKEISEYIFRIVSNIVKHFTYEELYPEQT